MAISQYSLRLFPQCAQTPSDINSNIFKFFEPHEIAVSLRVSKYWLKTVTDAFAQHICNEFQWHVNRILKHLNENSKQKKDILQIQSSLQNSFPDLLNFKTHLIFQKKQVSQVLRNLNENDSLALDLEIFSYFTDTNFGQSQLDKKYHEVINTKESQPCILKFGKKLLKEGKFDKVFKLVDLCDNPNQLLSEIAQYLSIHDYDLNAFEIARHITYENVKNKISNTLLANKHYFRALHQIEQITNNVDQMICEASISNFFKKKSKFHFKNSNTSEAIQTAYLIPCIQTRITLLIKFDFQFALSAAKLLPPRKCLLGLAQIAKSYLSVGNIIKATEICESIQNEYVQKRIQIVIDTLQNKIDNAIELASSIQEIEFRTHAFRDISLLLLSKGEIVRAIKLVQKYISNKWEQNCSLQLPKELINSGKFPTKYVMNLM